MNKILLYTKLHVSGQIHTKFQPNVKRLFQHKNNHVSKAVTVVISRMTKYVTH